MTNKRYCGHISIIGKPNVGKSTILNSFLGKKVSITSRKSQTTRNNIVGVKTENNFQMIFIDTPGMHMKSEKIMNKILNKSANSIIDDSDVIIFVIQRLKVDSLDDLILQKLKNSKVKIICVINKIDQIENKQKLLPLIAELSNKNIFEEIIPISAKTKDGLNLLENSVKQNLPENEFFYENSLNILEKDNQFMISELIREKIIRSLGDELPHDAYVKIDSMEEKNQILNISSTIYVKRNSQKQIIIGKEGKTLKKIATSARKDIEKYMNKKVFLKSWVKTNKNWNTDSDIIKTLGVGGNYESN
tara:strand:+ start:2375 stop:3286 length:912 start_codon:yes stop_codon:yes gene_type:complete